MRSSTRFTIDGIDEAHPLIPEADREAFIRHDIQSTLTARIAPALTPQERTRHIGKTSIFFGPPLAILTSGEKNTMEVSGRLNRTAERYLEILREYGLELSEPERQCITHICGIGFMSPLEIRELPFEARLTRFEAEGLDKSELAAKLEAASFADLIAVVESLGF
ncbi:MAG: hypothetical protein IPL58_05845 [Betaproteobacteria bacterium]|uniref:Uncharacterized protein n=1 Tax=Candidatus Proximibacter danicus TaxID=2954365 RepID=A0A9D7K3D6_9PROT|nr:hypothetical protein [Candidatus Proximibacter danicus]MBK9446648.1 hypothetical protein [Betaproteobacteria bacterium]